MITIGKRQPPRWWIGKFLSFYWRVFKFAIAAAWSFTKKHFAVSIMLGVLSAGIVLVASTPRGEDPTDLAVRSLLLTLAPMVLLASIVFGLNLVWAPFRFFLEVSEQLPHLRAALASYQEADFDIRLQSEPLVGDIGVGRHPVDLIVSNRGKTTEFEAEITSVTEMASPPRTPFSVRWATCASKRCPITRGHSEILQVATVHGSGFENPPNGMVDFLCPDDTHEFGVVLDPDMGGANTDAELTVLLTVSALDPPVSKRWPVTITWVVEFKSFRGHAEIGEGTPVHQPRSQG